MSLLEMIRAMLKGVSNKTIAAKMKLPLKTIERYRLAVDRFYNGAEKEPDVKWRKR